jgi:hypothetical protein
MKAKVMKLSQTIGDGEKPAAESGSSPAPAPEL